MDEGAKFVVENFKKILELVKKDEYKDRQDKALYEYSLIKSLKKTGDAYDHFLNFADNDHKNAKDFEFLEEYGVLSNEKISEYLEKNYPEELNNRVKIEDFVIDQPYTNSDLYLMFNDVMRGIRVNNKKNIIAVIMSHDKAYDDRWEDDILYYTGEGKKGKQKPTAQGNKALIISKETNSKIYLFDKVTTDKYLYRGEVYTVGSVKTEKQYDEDYNLRDVLQFQLKFVDETRKITYSPEDEKIIEDEKNKYINSLTDENIHKIAKTIKAGEIKYYYVKQAERNKTISKDTKNRANGICDLCGKEAPFKTKEGPYLESHHVITIAEGGPDVIYNTVALCPNCHRRMHSLKDPKDFEKLTKVIYKYLFDDLDQENLKNWVELFKQ